jgi:hypothetical protein
MTETTTCKTTELVKRWVNSENRVQRLRGDLNSAECEAANAANDLAKHLLPADAAEKEIFNVWFGNGLIQVAVDNNNNCTVKWRRLPTGKCAAELGI